MNSRIGKSGPELSVQIRLPGMAGWRVFGTVKGDNSDLFQKFVVMPDVTHVSFESGSRIPGLRENLAAAVLTLDFFQLLHHHVAYRPANRYRLPC